VQAPAFVLQTCKYGRSSAHLPNKAILHEGQACMHICRKYDKRKESTTRDEKTPTLSAHNANQPGWAASSLVGSAHSTLSSAALLSATMCNQRSSIRQSQSMYYMAAECQP